MSAVEIMLGSPDETLRVIEAAWDHFNAVLGAGEVDGAGSGGLLVRLERIGAKQTAAQAGVLRRFDAADAHDADGYGSSAAWLAARAGMTKKAAKTAVRQMRVLTGRPRLDDALAAGEITGSLLCQFHPDVCVHRNGWTLTRHPDGTIEARSPDGHQILRSHAPPGWTAA